MEVIYACALALMDFLMWILKLIDVYVVSRDDPWGGG